MMLLVGAYALTCPRCGLMLRSEVGEPERDFLDRAMATGWSLFIAGPQGDIPQDPGGICRECLIVVPHGLLARPQHRISVSRRELA